MRRPSPVCTSRATGYPLAGPQASPRLLHRWPSEAPVSSGRQLVEYMLPARELQSPRSPPRCPQLQPAPYHQVQKQPHWPLPASPSLLAQRSQVLTSAPPAPLAMASPVLAHGGLRAPPRTAAPQPVARSLSPAQAPQPPPVSRAPANTAGAPLAAGARVSVGGHAFQITSPLGKGSFGIVWSARGQDGVAAAIKEIACGSEDELGRAREEVMLLRRLGGGAALAGRVPAPLASEVCAGSLPGQWTVRLAMTQLPGVPLEQYLESQSLRLARHTLRTEEDIAPACRCAGELLVQLMPALASFSEDVYHRDVTPRNILIDDSGLAAQFGLVDFGLATDARRWRTGQDGDDLAGDGRYWPAAAWFAFGHGTQELAAYPTLNHEYRHCLDMHALGITALRCFMELLPPSPEPVTRQSTGGPMPGGASQPRPRALRALRVAWGRYWADARRFWQPVFDAFRGGGDFRALKRAYVAAGVHRVISMDLCAVRQALREAHRECLEFAVLSEGGDRPLAPLLDALLALLCSGREPGDEARGPARGAGGPPAAAASPQKRGGAASSARSPAGSDADTTASCDRASSGAASSPSRSSATESPTHAGCLVLSAEVSRAALAAEVLGQPADPTPRARPPRRCRNRAGGQP